MLFSHFILFSHLNHCHSSPERPASAHVSREEGEALPCAARRGGGVRLPEAEREGRRGGESRPPERRAGGAGGASQGGGAGLAGPGPGAGILRGVSAGAAAAGDDGRAIAG